MLLTKTGKGAGRTRRTVIGARDLTKVYGHGENRVEALAGVSLEVEAGEWVSLVGPSGSGKSTLMNMLGLLDRPTSGSYSLGGREVSGLKGAELSRARRELVGFVFQSYNLLAGETALANVELPMIYANVGRRERRRRATEALERVGLSGRIQHKPTELSGDQKDFAVETQEDLLSAFGQSTAQLNVFLARIAGISLLVGGIGIMLVSVAERTREIGLRKAPGATDANVLLQFLFEAVLLAALIGVLFGVIPAYRSARLAPVEALRRE